jgi:uncharacterized protein (TIGR02453 family)
VFRPALTFLTDLAAHNEKPWFEANRERFDRDVRDPCLAFVDAMAPRVEALSPHLRVVARGAGSSIGRIHRDTRFSADKSPYKDWIGIHITHEAGKDAPGLYLRISPAETGVGMGVWQLEPGPLRSVRSRIAAADGAWSDVRQALDANGFGFIGEALKRVPKEYPADHAFADDLKRKHFGAGKPVDASLPPVDFCDAVETAWREGWPLMTFLCASLELPL